MARYGLTVLLFASSLASGQTGAAIADDPRIFSERFRAEFRNMNETFAEFGFELEVIESERKSLTVITETYGEPDDDEEVDVIVALGGREARDRLTFYYFGEIGFGVRPADPEQLVLVVKRRAQR